MSRAADNKAEGTSTLIAGEHLFVTLHGSAYSQFKRALERRNFLLAWTLTAELPKVPLGDALSLLLTALDQPPWRFERAAPRWHARLCAEARLTLSEAQLALAALEALGAKALSAAVRLSSQSATCTASTMWSGSSTPGSRYTTEATRHETPPPLCMDGDSATVAETGGAGLLLSGERNSAQDGGRVRRRSAASHGKLKRAA